MSNIYNVGLVGCGLIADIHIEEILNHLPKNNVSVCDNVKGKAELLRKKYSLKNSYSDIGDMLSKENLFCTHILTPPSLHVEHAIKCVNAGCNVLVEKPLTINLKDANKIYKIAKRNKTKVYVNHSLLFQDCVQK